MTPDPDQAPPNPQLEIERVAVCYAMHGDDPKAVEDVLSLPACCWTDWAAKGALACLKALQSSGDRVDILSAGHWMKARKGWDQYQSVLDISDMANVVNFRESLLRIAEFGKKRALAVVGKRIMENADNPDMTAEEAEKAAWADLAGAGDVQVRKSAGLKPISYQEMMRKLVGRMQDEGKDHGRILTPFNELNAITRGFGKSDMVILASRPKMGKSAIATQIGRYVAENHGPVLEITLEMDTEELSERFLSQSSKKEKDKHEIDDAMAEANSDLKYYFYERGSSLKLLERRARKFLVAHPDAKMIIVDQLGLVKPESKHLHSRNEIVSEVSTTLKTLTSQLRVCFLVLHQIRRPGEKDSVKKPTMEDLKDSGKVEEDANMILLLHRRPGSETAILEVAGNRGGNTGKLELAWHGPTVSYLPISKKKSEPRAPVKESTIIHSDVPLHGDEDFPDFFRP